MSNRMLPYSVRFLSRSVARGGINISRKSRSLLYVNFYIFPPDCSMFVVHFIVLKISSGVRGNVFASTRKIKMVCFENTRRERKNMRLNLL